MVLQILFSKILFAPQKILGTWVITDKTGFDILQQDELKFKDG